MKLLCIVTPDSTSQLFFTKGKEYNGRQLTDEDFTVTDDNGWETDFFDLSRIFKIIEE